MIYTTLNKIREHSPCADGWKKLLAHLGKTAADPRSLAALEVAQAHAEGRATDAQLAAAWAAAGARMSQMFLDCLESTT